MVFEKGQGSRTGASFDSYSSDDCWRSAMAQGQSVGFLIWYGFAPPTEPKIFQSGGCITSVLYVV